MITHYEIHGGDPERVCATDIGGKACGKPSIQMVHVCYHDGERLGIAGCMEHAEKDRICSNPVLIGMPEDRALKTVLSDNALDT